MTYADFLEEALLTRHFNPELRLGQSLMNALSNNNLALYDKIKGTPFDCFYVDSKVPLFLDEVHRRWVDYFPDTEPFWANQMKAAAPVVDAMRRLQAVLRPDLPSGVQATEEVEAAVMALVEKQGNQWDD